MYKLVIADDEYRIRLGLKSFIDWKALGFEVAATFEDGDELLRYVEQNPDVDVILTDIQMNRVSGIQVAEAVKQCSPAPRVVFISAYEQLDYAFAAIENNVIGYIIKPIDHSKLRTLFQTVKKELDDEYQMREIKTHYSMYQKNIADTKEYFFADLLTNAPTSSKTAMSLFQIMYPTLSFEECMCFEVILKLPEYNHFMKHIWATTNNDLYAALRDSIRLFDGECEYWLTNKRNDTLILSGIRKTASGSLADLSPEAASLFIHEEAAKLTGALARTYETPISISSIRTFRGIPGLANSLFSRELHSSRNVTATNVIDQTKEYIRTHIEEDLSLETISEHFFLSQAYFSKLFKSTTGENLVDFIIREKMEYVKELLSNPNIKIYEIAERIGYKSVSHFNRQFKNYTNMTPNEYRKEFLG